MSNLILNKNQIAELESIYKKAEYKRFANRINTILLLHKGYFYREIENILLIDTKTIKRYKKVYEKLGVDGLLQNNHKGGQTKLSKEQEKELIDHLDKNLYSTSSEVCEYVRKKYGIEYTVEGMVHTLNRLGFSYKKTKLVPAKADKEKQEAFVELYYNLRKNMKKAEKVYFMDAVHPTHNVMPAYGWIKKGKEKGVKSNSGRQRININGVYSPNDGEIIIRDDESINSQSTIELLKMIENKHPELSKIYVIRDNAKYYSSKLVKEYLETSKIEFIALPSYSPNLNLIERLWKLFKKKTLYNKYYESYDIFRDAVYDFFQGGVEKYSDEIKSLLAENFHIMEATI
ncbi:IS630 family transposase [archaeon]|nr:IS630 family transposase [archaeon]